jgi:hypothetical protein
VTQIWPAECYLRGIVSSRTPLVAFLFSMLFLAGCGRSSILGGSPEDCPVSLIQKDGTCCPPERTLPDNTCMTVGGDMGDGGHGDMGDGGHSDMADMLGDTCSDPKNCKLPECVGDPRCHVLGTEICNNGIDDNNDGLIDCKDPECFNFPGCQMHMCDPNNPDCTDPMCVMLPACQNLKCHPTVDFGTINPKGSSSTKMENTKGTTDVAVTPCAPGGAGMVVGQFTLSGDAAVTLTYSQNMGMDTVFGLFRAGVNQGCGDNPVECYDPKGALTGNHTFQQLKAGNYYIISQPFEPAGQGPLTVTLSTPTLPEICNNGIDDNGNGLIDCADPDCFTSPNCINQECTPDFTVGALVVNGPGKSVSFTTKGADTSENLTCQGANGGGDVVVKFTLLETAGILLDFSQGGDHVIGLFRSPQPGEKCDNDQLSCFDPSGSGGATVAWGEYPPGDYEFIFKALKPGQEGHIDATISAYRNRQVELCHNGIDDDGNGLIDCADPACAGVSGCSAPYCMPNVQLGNMAIGDQQSVMLNIQANGVAGLKTSCTKGAGKAEVVQLTVTGGGSNGGFGMGFDCTQTGDQVLALDLAGGPRDPCDVNELVCGDPKTLPFGCGYEVPNLQPGTYNVIVQAFQPGSEGNVNLTLSILDDRQLEICNNGIDDDKNGLTDCKDPKCVTNPVCAASQCKPDATIDPLALTGQTTFTLVQSANNGVHGQVPCATTVGGQSAIIAITLTAKADLNMQWNQIGNHDFALFTNAGTVLPCDSGTLTGTCTKSMGSATGMATFTGVPQGKYYLIVQGDKPDAPGMQSSGSVNIALSGMPSP